MCMTIAVGYDKLEPTKKQIVDKAVKKLELLLHNMPDFKSRRSGNNPAIHDSYGKDFYVYKYMAKGHSVRLLYRYTDRLEIHMAHFKQGDRDNSKYIEVFENYVRQYK